MMPIGDFSRATHLTVKTLRHYHETGLLVPADVDAATGYRRYSPEQIPTAQVIRRFRDLGMPVPEIRSVLDAPDPVVRGERIAAHLTRLEDELGRTQRAVTALRDLLGPPAETEAQVQLVTVPETPAAAVTDVVDAADGPAWLQGALGELYATLTAQGIATDGPSGGVYADEVFTQHRGRVTVYVPCAAPVRPLGRVQATTIPAAELAVLEHAGGPEDVDRAYGVLAAYVTRHALAVEGPIRERYLVNGRDTQDSSRWRTEICWPVFLTR